MSMLESQPRATNRVTWRPVVPIIRRGVLTGGSSPLEFQVMPLLNHDVLPGGDARGWPSSLIALMMTADVPIDLVHVVIVRRARLALPFIRAFVAFIIACGLTHFVAPLTARKPPR